MGSDTYNVMRKTKDLADPTASLSLFGPRAPLLDPHMGLGRKATWSLEIVKAVLNGKNTKKPQGTYDGPGYFDELEWFVVVFELSLRGDCAVPCNVLMNNFSREISNRLPLEDFSGMRNRDFESVDIPPQQWASTVANRSTDLSPKPSFRYPSLHANQDTFHLLVLLPLKKSGMNVECRIGLARLDDQVAFKALSYVWGNPHGTRNIRLDGIDFPVTENLHSALRRLRYKGNGRPRVLWVVRIKAVGDLLKRP